MNKTLPSWLVSGTGDSNILVLAPHGGISEKDLLQPSSWPRKGNDLRTAALGLRLAEELSASFLINDSLDRNAIDLNRIDQTARDAPVFLEALETHLENLLRSRERVRILVVHGWHITQSKVDFGFGQRLLGARDEKADADRLTCSEEFLRGPLAHLCANLDADGIEATCGEQWPAAHRNNMMQLFRRTGGADVPEACESIRRIAARGKLDAIQLELGAPLRWEGSVCDQFRKRLRESLTEPNATAIEVPAAKPVLEPDPQQATLQFVDSRSGLAVLAGMALMPNRTMGARFMIFLPDGRVGVFVGHGRPRGALEIHGFSLEQSDDTLSIHFDNHLYLSSAPASYFQFETEQSRTPLHAAQLNCEARPTDLGIAVTGDLRVDGEHYSLQATGLPGPLAGGPFGRRAGRRLYLAHANGRGENLQLPEGSLDETCTAGDGRQFRIEAGPQIAVLRTQPDRATRLEFGPARFHFTDGTTAIGLIESIRVITQETSPAQSG
ncbi:MAG: hypothetical protein P8K76_17180 [Candidatus Binatia bacterium]|nr:hypothetical protein [Candidatus Binatia bacterium]MDG2011497.1 hypothetical protein [Candidatus Binatia bacterium]